MTSSAHELQGWDLPQSPFHPGELAIQERVGVRAKVGMQARRVVRRVLTEQHREFFARLNYVFIGSVDAKGRPWASMLLGKAGFVSSPDDKTLRLRAKPLFGDPLHENLRDGAELAVLGVELPTRRRNRAIGVAADVEAEGFSLRIRQTLGICPQYIQGRRIEFVGDPLAPQPHPLHRSDRLDAAAKDIISRADTFFVASVDPREEDGVAKGADISHRGGRPGFVRVDDDRTLTTPDFVGNFMFNTLGNFAVEPRAGLLFIDFDRGDTLYVAAHAEVIWDGPELNAFAGAQRLIRYSIDSVTRVEASLPARFSSPEYSPTLARTGAWDEVRRNLDAARSQNKWRPFRIARIEDESSNIRSFYLEPADSGGLAGFKPGQFLPIRPRPPGALAPASRSYTLSDAPDGRSYRISVKREGRGGVSDWLHDEAKIGAIIDALAPGGDFTFDEASGRPAVLVSAGVGVTPMIAMLNSLLVNEGRTRFHSRLIFIHGARNGREQAFAQHIRSKAAMHSNLTTHIRFSKPRMDDEMGASHDSEGRVDLELIKSLLKLDDYDFYLCGPTPFMQSLYDGLIGIGVRDERIKFETFEPASVARAKNRVVTSESEEGVVVNFVSSNETALWRPGDGSLLELAERTGVPTVSSCRSGVCGACATRIVNGEVDYSKQPEHEIGPREALICSATPRPGLHLSDGTLNREGVSLDL